MSDPISPFKAYLYRERKYKGGKSTQQAGGEGKKLYKLSSNENPIGPSPKAVAALQESIENLHIYPDGTAYRVQEALVDFYDQQLTSDQFIVTNSGSEMLEHIIRAFLGEGLEFIISSPSFSPYQMFSNWQGADVVDIPLKAPDFSLDVDGILGAINEKTRLIFVTSPNNPTGTHIPKASLDRLIDNCPDHVMIVVDEVYFHFADAADYTTALPYVLAGKNVIAVNSFSKTYGLAAMRIGYGYTTPKLAAYIRNLSRPFIVNTLSLNAAVAALQDIEFIQATVNLVRNERERLYPLLDELPIQYWKTQGNFILMRSETKTSQELEQFMLKEGVMVRDVTPFGAPGHIRVSIGTQEANDALIQGLKNIL